MLLYLLTWLTVFRAAKMVRMLREAADDWERRKIIAIEFLKVCLASITITR